MGSVPSITKSADITQIFREGTARSTPYFTLLTLKRAINGPRFGVVVSRRLGGAVQRNRQKRVYRAILRELLQVRPLHADFIIIPRKQSIHSTFQVLRDTLQPLLDDQLSTAP